ncbi:MAG: cyclase family protein [Bacteroidetes bacterium]|jgi:kynurenine formamidase|nr:cyclase family protein [Bacteroidota bacterium]
MQATININKKNYIANLNQPLDISIPLHAGIKNVIAWYAPPVEISPVRMDNWVGEVAQGGSVNFRNVFFNPHAHGTHTECVGHITREWVSLNQNLKHFFFSAKLITVMPEEKDGDKIIYRQQLEEAWADCGAEALILRTLPNNQTKLTAHYSGTNPPYLHHEAAAWMVKQNIRHLLLDLPSVDREQDGGKLLAHNAFWNTANQVRYDATITELIFVSDQIKDGLYLLNLQITALENDASPSKPLLFELKGE